MNQFSHWQSSLNRESPFWQPYGELLGRVDGSGFPDASSLNTLLPCAIESGGGKRLRFVAASQTQGVDYERHIFETGEVSTREDNWHDLFNALVWCRLPRLKAALNALHYSRLDAQRDGRRGALRDALTLLDESGVIVLGRDRTVLQALARRDWQDAFCRQPEAWKSEMRVVVCGHGLLEKFLRPYKSITAHALLCHVGLPPCGSIGDYPLAGADAALAQLLLDGALLGGPADLSPLPLMGIPGWWQDGDQDQAFYADAGVFRPGPVDFKGAPVHLL